LYDYKGSDSPCAVTSQNEGKSCQIEFELDQDVHGDLYVYYELNNYYQNHRIYVASRSAAQLQGDSVAESVLSTYCNPKLKEDGLILNPCGLIAYSYFTDIISLSSSDSSPSNLFSLDEGDIAWASDKDQFVQPNDFKYVKIDSTSVTCSDSNLPSNCKQYCDTSTSQCYNYFYPNDDTIKYLYESYPDQISPIDGVTDEHFRVWMRTAALPNFRKLYGKISNTFKKGDRLVFDVTANYEVASFNGKKRLVISTVGEFGGKNPYLGITYIIVGAINLFFGFLIAFKQIIYPRPLGDPSLLPWN